MNKPAQQDDGGWDWFDGALAHQPETDRETLLAYARCFSGTEGERVLNHLRAQTLERAMGPEAPNRLLRHVEGQRQLVTIIERLVHRGQSGN